ncbi:autotransporter-associated beta strand repeat-containing protein [Salmonella enterica subsp. enterica serovar Senftenberg]|nr:autotransporter-associated beta strand repeat-containing protein [Salmonella enterica subsp. enterica serovar Senftenberg]
MVKSGDETLTLSGANSYTGGTTISGGTLVASNVEALGTGDITDNATLELNAGGTFDNVISGSGQVVKSGDDALTLSGANSYTGGTTISGGTLVANNVEALGTGDVTNNATLELNTGGDFTNAISGSGGSQIRRQDAHALRRQQLQRRYHHQRRHADCHSRQRAGYGRYRQPRQPVAGRQRPVYGNGSHHRKRRQHRNRRRQYATGDHADAKAIAR